VILNTDLFSTIDVYEREVGKEIIMTCTYSGFSMLKNLPSVMLDYMFVFETGEMIIGMGRLEDIEDMYYQ
jgi:hypothetical protein